MSLRRSVQGRARLHVHRAADRLDDPDHPRVGGDAAGEGGESAAEGSRAAALAARDADGDRQVQGCRRHGPDPARPRSAPAAKAIRRTSRRWSKASRRQRRVGAQAQVPAPDPDRSADELDRVGPARVSGSARTRSPGAARTSTTSTPKSTGTGARRDEVQGLVGRDCWQGRMLKTSSPAFASIRESRGLHAHRAADRARAHLHPGGDGRRAIPQRRSTHAGERAADGSLPDARRDRPVLRRQEQVSELARHAR